MAENPRAALRQVRPGVDQALAYTGPATISILDDADRRHAVVLYEFTLEGVRMSAYAAAEDAPLSTCGSSVRLRGWRAGDRAAVSEVSILRDAADPVCAPTGEQHIAILLIYGPSGKAPAIPPSQVNDLLFGAGPETPRQQYLKSSYQQLSISGAAFGWYRLARTYTCWETDALRTDALAAAARDVDMSQYQRLLILLDPSVRSGTACAWSGMGQIGCSQGMSTAWLWMTPEGVPVATIIHEFGHNLGLGHARSLQFPHDTLEPDLTRAYYREYGDGISLMGHGSGPFAASQKLLLGWLHSNEVAQVEQNGDFVLKPLQAPDRGLKALRIRRGPGLNEWLWIEYRQPDTDYDSIPEATFAKFVLRYETPSTGRYSDILASLPAENPSDAQFEISPGNTWHDAHSAVTIETGNPSDSGAPVSVRYDIPCATFGQVVGTAAAAGQSISIPVNAAPDCVWTAQSNSVWLDQNPSGSSAGPATLTVTAAPNPDTSRTGSVTIARQPVFVNQPGARPTPALLSVFPTQGPVGILNTFYSELSFLQSKDVAEVHVLYNTTAAEQGGCAVRYNLATGQYSVANPDGSYSTSNNSDEWHTYAECNTGYYKLGDRGGGVTYLGYNVGVAISQPSLFVRFLTTDGRTTAWQRAATYNGASSCYLGFWQTDVEVVSSGGPSSLALIGGACPWTLSADAAWIHLPKTSGVGQTTLSLTIDANPGTATRTGHVTVNQQTIPVMQLGSATAWSVTYIPAELDVSATAGLHSVLAEVEPRDFGVFTADVPWISIESLVSDPIGGEGNAPCWDITFRVQENDDNHPRTGTISGAGFSVPVRQAAGGIRLSPTSDAVPAVGGARLLSVETAAPDGAWAASASADWIQIRNSPAGTGSAILAYSVAPNPAPQARIGDILFGTLAFEVTQGASGVSLPPSYTVKPLAGQLPGGLGGPVSNVLLDRPTGLAFDSRKNLYISDRLRHVVLRVSPDGTVTNFAGSGACCFSGDGASALYAELNAPDSIAVDAGDNVFIVDHGTPRVRRVDTNGIITTVVGNGSGTASGDNGAATAAGVWVMGLAFDAKGNPYLSDSANHNIRKVDATGIITTIAGTGRAGFAGDGGPARSAQLNVPNGITVDAAGNILIADSNNGRIRRITTDGLINTLASGLNYPQDVKVDGTGNVLVAEYNGRISRISPDGTLVTAVASLQARPYRLALDPNGDLLVAQSLDSQVRRITSDGAVQAWAGLPQAVRLIDPRASTVDAAGNVYIAEGEAGRIYQMGPDGSLKVFATGPFTSLRDLLALPDGTLLAAYLAANGIYQIRNGAVTPWAPAANAGLSRPSSLATDAAGNLYVVDSGKHTLLRIAVDGTVSTLAGNGQPGTGGDGGPANQAQLNYPYTVAVDTDGSIYIAEWRRIRRIGVNQTIQTVLSADLPTTAIFAFDPSGAFIIPDSSAPTISRLAPLEGTTVIAGSQIGVTDQEVNGRAASFVQPAWIRADGQGNLYVADSSADRVYVLTKTGH